MNVGEVMTGAVCSLRPYATVDEAAHLLLSRGFGAAPVLNPAGEVLGIVTEADLVRDRVVPASAERSRGTEHTVAEVMTVAPLCVGSDEELSRVALQMLRTGDHMVLVVDGARLVGVVTARDLLTGMAAVGRTG